MKRLFCILLCVLCLLSFCACDRQPVSVTPSLSATEITLRAFTEQTVTLYNADEVVWATDAQDLTLIPQGNTCLITGTAAQTATVTASCNGVDYTVQVTVTDGFTFGKDAVSCSETYGTLDTDGRKTDTLRFLKYESSDPMVVSVDESGVLTPHRAGTATVRAYTAKEGTLDELTVTVYKTDIMLSDYNLRLSVGQTATLTAEKDCEWTTSDPDIATVADGLVTAIANGTATVTATCGNISETCEIVVTDKTRQIVTFENDTIGKIGRGYYADDAYVFANCASGFTVAFYGTSLSARLFADSQISNPSAYLGIIVDGEFTAMTELKVTDKQDYILAEGLTDGYHTVTVLKTDEASASDCVLYALTCEGVFTDAPASPSLKIEVFGDSISAGLSNMKLTGTDDGSAKQNSLYAYGPILARMLGADVSVHACSGICLCSANGMNVIYRYTGCNTTSYYSEKAVEWNTKNYVPDIVIIHLGTNDFSKKWYDKAEFVAQYKQFINTLRTLYGEDTLFLLCEGSMTNEVSRQVVEAAKDEPNTYVVSLGLVAKGHPSSDEQAVIAKMIYKKILSINNQ